MATARMGKATLENIMKTCIVTGCDIKYLPGVKALYNSIKQNGNTDVDIILLAHGEIEDFADLPNDIRIIYNEETHVSPSGGEWKEQIPAMYSRVLIPRILTEYDRALWLDADTIVLKDLTPLLEIDLQGCTCAASLPAYMDRSLNTLHYQLEEPHLYPEHRDLKALQAGVMLFDIAKWNEAGLNERVDQLLEDNVKFKFVVQGLLGMAVGGDFLELPYEWNTYGNWVNAVGLQNINILHFVGGIAESPWSHKHMLHQHIWEQYK